MSLYTLDDFFYTTPPTADRSGSGWVLREVSATDRYVGLPAVSDDAHRCDERRFCAAHYKRRANATDLGARCGKGVPFVFAQFGREWGDFGGECTAAEAT